MRLVAVRPRDPHTVPRGTVLRTLGTGVAAAGAGRLGVVDTDIGDELHVLGCGGLRAVGRDDDRAWTVAAPCDGARRRPGGGARPRA